MMSQAPQVLRTACKVHAVAPDPLPKASFVAKNVALHRDLHTRSLISELEETSHVVVPSTLAFLAVTFQAS